MEIESPGWFEDLRVFVYGTLKPGGFYWQRFCEGKVDRWWPARTRGEVYHLPIGYPASVFGGDCWIQGVVLEMKDIEAMKGLDSLEGFDPYRTVGNDYRRLRVEVFDLESDRVDRVWSYEMDLRKIVGQGGIRVESGNWQQGLST
tara:strand:- start:21883 stop:22317 length:435 start_codon:yes stop_codon:yes gene_type:complete